MCKKKDVVYLANFKIRHFKRWKGLSNPLDEKGEIISRENIRRIRPGMGLKPELFESLLGKKLIKDVKSGQRVKKCFLKKWIALNLILMKR